MEILTGEQMRRVDRRAIDELGIPGLQLMEAAGRGVAERLLAEYPEARASPLLVLCGKGNNGGDGLVAARWIARAGAAPRLFLVGRASELQGDAAASYRAARAEGLEVREVADESDLPEIRGWLARSPIVLDALLGTGVRGGARGLVATIVEDLNRSAARVVALDLPSGVDADSAQLAGPAVRAARTYTLCRPKLPLVLGAGAGLAGRWSVIPIGIPDDAVRAEAVDLEWLDAETASRLLPVRPAGSHKGDYGHLLAVAGSRAKSGAAVLLARGALRCGVGLITVAAPVSAQERIAVQQAEVMTEPLPESAGGCLARDAVEVVAALASGRDALALGPGLGAEPDTCEAVRRIVERSAVPTVVDADGLNALAPLGGRTAVVRATERVLTPHPGEAGRLLGRTADEVQRDRLAAARGLARESGAVVVLKGQRSIVAAPDGRAAINSSGNAGMATAGTGDVLTGGVGAFLARGLGAFDAARLAVFVHGDAGDRAARELGQDGMIASDLVDRLPAALACLARRGG